MPKFSQKPIEVKKPGKPKGIPQALVDEYKLFVDGLDKGNIGTLEFKKDENINLARKALVQAGEELKKYVRVRKPRGQESVLEFQRITRQGYVEAKMKNKERGAKIKKAKATPKKKAKAKK